MLEYTTVVRPFDTITDTLDHMSTHGWTPIAIQITPRLVPIEEDGKIEGLREGAIVHMILSRPILSRNPKA